MNLKTILLQTEITEGRVVIAHFMQVAYDDSGNEVARSKNPHTVALAPDADIDAIFAAVNTDITTRDGMKWAPIEADEWSRAVGHCEVEHTPTVKAAYEQFKAIQAATSAEEAPVAKAQL